MLGPRTGALRFITEAYLANPVPAGLNDIQTAIAAMPQRAATAATLPRNVPRVGLPLVPSANQLQAAVAAAPGVIAVFTGAKNLINAALSAKLIPKAQQDELHAVCDARMAAGQDVPRSAVWATRLQGAVDEASAVFNSGCVSRRILAMRARSAPPI